MNTTSQSHSNTLLLRETKNLGLVRKAKVSVTNKLYDVIMALKLLSQVLSCTSLDQEL